MFNYQVRSYWIVCYGRQNVPSLREMKGRSKNKEVIHDVMEVFKISAPRALLPPLQVYSKEPTLHNIESIVSTMPCSKNNTETASPPSWSEYEITRARNIERNNAKLRSLGLISEAEERVSNAAAWGKSSSSSSTAAPEKNNQTDTTSSPSRKRKRTKKGHQEKAQGQSSIPSRKSLRVKGLAPDGSTSSSTQQSSMARAQTKLSLEQERQQRQDECRQARQRAAVQHASLGAARAARENPTATYEHCLMRVRTMTDQQLRNRVKTIERCAGKHCVIKMAIMASCLQDEGEWELAQVAAAALERLKALKSPPET